MACHIGGYPQDRFQSAVDKNFFCPICTEVLKEPLQCHNQHYFCSGCITEHLKNSKTCPMCVEKLTEESLSKPPRIVTGYLNGLMINCDNSERGCTQTMELGVLKNHTPVCNYRPVVCPDERCGTTVNMKDLEEHKSTSCEYRLVHCNDCDEEMSVKKYVKHVCLLHKEVQEMKTVLLDVKNQVTQFFDVQDKMVKLMENLSPNVDKMVPSEVQIESTRSDEEQTGNILVLGGSGNRGLLKSVELYCINKGMWTLREPMLGARASHTAHYYKDEVLVSGGCFDQLLNAIECFKLEDGSLSWTQSLAKLLFEVEGHKTVIINDLLIVIGGRDAKGSFFNSIQKIQLCPPFASTVECYMPQPLAYHGVECFGNDILIFGGATDRTFSSRVNNIWLYNTIRNAFTSLLPLPIPIQKMATVKCGDDVLIIGGEDERGRLLNSVLKYNYKKSTYKQLPSMKYCRAGCSAVHSGNKVYVMGGHRKGLGKYKRDEPLSVVECFDLDRQVWEELAPMSEKRDSIAAILLPEKFC